MYKERRRVLDGDDMKESVLGMMKETVANHVYQVISDELPPEEWDLAALNAELLPIVPLNKIVLTDAEKSSGKVDDLVARLQEETVALYEQKEKEFEDFDLREIERIILLKVIDRKWMDHIDDMDQLREGIGLQAYGQRDPVVEYRMAGFEMFNDMTKAIQEETTGALFHVQVEQKIEREEAPKITGTNKDAEVEKKPYVRKGAKVGRNDPCPCGSGKKYKNCCGRNK
nr:SEC-C metal-binding domain-containing protein [Anaerostipes hadrus]